MTIRQGVTAFIGPNGAGKTAAGSPQAEFGLAYLAVHGDPSQVHLGRDVVTPQGIVL